MNATTVAKQAGATLRKISGGSYEVTTKDGQRFTITSDYDDSDRLRWYARPGAFPGGAPFEVEGTLRQAVVCCVG